MIMMEHISAQNEGTGDKHVCGVCGESCSTVFEFLKHKIIHVDKGVGLGCEICQLAFSRQGPLQDHYRRKHQINLARKTDDQVAQSTKLQHKKIPVYGKISPPCVKENSRVNDGTEDVMNNVRITKFDILPKGEMLIVRHVGNIQEHTSDIVVESVNQIGFENVHPVQRIEKIQNDCRGLLNSLSSEQMTSIDTVESDTSHTSIYSGEKISEKQYEINTVSAGDEAVKNIETNNCDADGDLFSTHKLQWCEEANAAMNVEFTSDSISTNVETIDYVSECVQIPSISLKNSDGKLVDSSETDDHFMEEQHGEETNIPQTSDVNGIVGNELVSTFATNSFADVNMANNSNAVEDKVRLGTTNTENKKKVFSSCPVKKGRKFTRINGKIPQELNMSDFYFLKTTSQSGSSLARCSGRDSFQCLLCKKVMKWRSDLCRHMREFHVDDLDSGEALKLPAELDDDEANLMKMSEYIDLEAVRKPGKRVRGIETQDLPGEYACEECGKVFNRMRSLRYHRRLHETGNEFLCSICSKLLKTKVYFEKHWKTHQKREAYKCNQCDFESSVNIAIHKHRQIHNTNSYLCDICGLAYKDKSTLTKHKKVHDLARPFACTHPGCAWRFMTEVRCNAHIRSHTSKRKFECETCGYVFTQKHHLQRHEKLVHNIVHKTKPGFYPYVWNTEGNSELELQSNSKEANSLEVSHEVNLIINEGNITGDMSSEHFDLEGALQSGQLVIANDDGTSINYEMSDIGSNVVYQTLLHDGVEQQFETHTVCIAPSDSGDVSFHEVDSVQTEVEIEQS